METSNTALRAKNDAAAERELRELRADTIEGLKYAIDLVRGELPFIEGFGYTPPRSAHTALELAIELIESRWPA